MSWWCRKAISSACDDFSANAPPALVTGFLRAVGEVARKLDLPKDGYRVLANIGANAGQEVPHLHFHIFAGKPSGADVDAGIALEHHATPVIPEAGLPGISDAVGKRSYPGSIVAGART